MNTKKKHTADAVIKAIADSAGIKTTIGKRLGVSRGTVERYLINYPSAMAAYKNEVDGVGDFVEAVILQAIRDKDIETAKWYAKNKLKERGYAERYEFVKEFRDMTDEQLVQFIADRAGAVSGRDAGSGTTEPHPPTIH